MHFAGIGVIGIGGAKDQSLSGPKGRRDSVNELSGSVSGTTVGSVEAVVVGKPLSCAFGVDFR